MPELPEVETIRRGLEQEVSGRRIVFVSVANLKVLKGQSEAEFRDRAVGKRIQGVDRRGKYLLIPLHADGSPTPSITLCIHLKMRGSVRLQTAETPLARYHGLSLVLEGEEELRYFDMWGWGEWRAVEATEPLPLPVFGIEPLAASWTAEALSLPLAKTRSAIKVVLLNQAILAGVGNIYADEALFRARICPTRPASELSFAEVRRLAEALRLVLTEAVALGGSVGDYVDIYGQPGRYVPQVYDREGSPCPVCDAPLKKRKLGGRGTTYCLACQT